MNAITGGLPHDAYNASMYELLKTIDDPAQLRALERRQLDQLASELRAYVLECAVPKVSYFDSARRGKPEMPSSMRRRDIASRRPVRILCA